MADLIIQDTTLQAIANAIREKTGGSEALTPTQMASEVTDKLSAGGAGGGDIDALIDGSITEIESDVETLGAYTFYSKKKLTSAKFPNVTSLGRNAFYGCEKLESLDLPMVTNVPVDAFYQCRKLTSLKLGQVTQIGTSAFSLCESLPDVVDYPFVTSVGEYAFQYCKTITSVILPLITQIPSNCFFSCKALKNIDMPLVTRIYSNGFNDCGFTNIHMPEVARVDTYGLGNLHTATSIVLPKVNYMAQQAVASCFSLIKVIIGTETDTICTSATSVNFSSCYHILGTTNATYNPNGLKDGYIYVPNALVASYRTATNWSTYASQIFPWVATTEELANIDTTLYDKACVGYENDGTEYSYDGTQWTEVIR